MNKFGINEPSWKTQGPSVTGSGVVHKEANPVCSLIKMQIAAGKLAAGEVFLEEAQKY